MKEYTRLWNKDFICICLIQFLFSISNNLIGSIVTSYAEVLHSTAAQAALLAGIFYAVSFLCRSVVGPVQASVDEKKLLLFSYSVGLIANLGYAIAPSYGVFVCFRLLQGVQMAFTGSVNLSVAGGSVPREKLSQGIGYFAVCGALSSMLGPVVGISFLNILKSAYGPERAYRLIFLVAASFMLASLLISLIISPRGTPQKSAGASGAWYKNILDVHVIFPACIISFVVMSYSMYISYLVPYSGEVGIANISPFFLVSAAAMLILRPVQNKITDRLGRFNTLYISLAMFAVSYICLGLLRNMGGVIIAGVLGSAGYTASYAGLQAICIESAASSRRGIASNTCYLGIDLGYFVGPMIFGGWLYPMVQSYAKMYLLVAVPLVIAAVLASIYRPIFAARRKQLEQES